jgi:hypothetical protein
MARASAREDGLSSFMQGGDAACRMRPGSFLQQLRRSNRRQSGMMGETSWRADAHDAKPQPARALKDPLLPSLASNILKEAVLDHEECFSTSSIGVFQFIDACNLRGFCVLLAVLYPLYVMSFPQCVFVTSCPGTSS